MVVQFVSAAITVHNAYEKNIINSKHRLRNAIAHARYSIDESQAFAFWDRRKPNEAPFWEASISNKDLMTFLSKVAHLVSFLRDDPRYQSEAGQ